MELVSFTEWCRLNGEAGMTVDSDRKSFLRSVTGYRNMLVALELLTGVRTRIRYQSTGRSAVAYCDTVLKGEYRGLDLDEVVI
jgi:hypothetical protein